MPKEKKIIDPAVEAAFEAIMGRIKLVTGARTQVQLAEVLEVRQSSISDAKRRCSVPDTWLVKLERSHKVLAIWLLDGEGPKFVGGPAHEAITAIQERLTLITEDFGHLSNRIEDNLVILTMTDAELARRKDAAAKGLAVDHKVIQGIQAQLTSMAADAAAQTH